MQSLVLLQALSESNSLCNFYYSSLSLMYQNAKMYTHQQAQHENSSIVMVINCDQDDAFIPV